MEGLVPSRMVLYEEKGGLSRVAVVTRVYPDDLVDLYVFPVRHNPLGEIAALVSYGGAKTAERGEGRDRGDDPYWRWPDRG